MAKITLGGNPAETLGVLPKTGSKAPDFTLIATDLSEKLWKTSTTIKNC